MISPETAIGPSLRSLHVKCAGGIPIMKGIISAYGGASPIMKGESAHSHNKSANNTFAYQPSEQPWLIGRFFSPYI